MQRLIVKAAVTLALASAPGAVAATASTASTSPQAVAAKACRYGKIGGHRKHLCRGQYCSRAHARQYRKYGFSCSKRDRRGSWHLR